MNWKQAIFVGILTSAFIYVLLVIFEGQLAEMNSYLRSALAGGGSAALAYIIVKQFVK